jgi:hypothetical protein
MQVFNTYNVKCKETNSKDSEELLRLRSEYTIWCNRMDYLGRWGAMYDCQDTSHRFLHKVYYYFIFLCTIYAVVGWSVALGYALIYETAIPCFLSTYEIHSDNKKKDTWEAIGIILLTLIPVINFIFRPKWFRANYSSETYGTALQGSGFCPLSNVATLKKLVSVTKLNCILAYSIPLLGLVFGVLVWNLNLYEIIKTNGKFSCGDGFLIYLDQAIVFPIYFMTQVVIGHTSMSFALKVTYFKQALTLMMDSVKNAPNDDKFNPLVVIDRFNEIQRRINLTGKKFGMYIGIYTLFCVLCSSLFVGKFADACKYETTNIIDLIFRIFYQCLFILPNIYVLVRTASLGTTGMRIMRTYLRRPFVGNDDLSIARSSYAINYFNLRLNVADVGLRVYGIQLNFKTLTQIFSLWGTFLSMIYSTASKQ